MLLTLERFAYTSMGTFGRFIADGEQICMTVERPWKENQPSVSCIPEGIYRMELGRYNRGGYPAFELIEVPGRSLIKIHKGNTMDDLAGCIAPGERLGTIGSKWAVVSSAPAFDRLMGVLGRDDNWSIVVTRDKLSGKWSH